MQPSQFAHRPIFTPRVRWPCQPLATYSRSRDCVLARPKSTHLTLSMRCCSVSGWVDRFLPASAWLLPRHAAGYTWWASRPPLQQRSTSLLTWNFHASAWSGSMTSIISWSMPTSKCEFASKEWSKQPRCYRRRSLDSEAAQIRDAINLKPRKRWALRSHLAPGGRRYMSAAASVFGGKTDVANV